MLGTSSFEQLLLRLQQLQTPLMPRYLDYQIRQYKLIERPLLILQVLLRYQEHQGSWELNKNSYQFPPIFTKKEIIPKTMNHHTVAIQAPPALSTKNTFSSNFVLGKRSPIMISSADPM